MCHEKSGCHPPLSKGGGNFFRDGYWMWGKTLFQITWGGKSEWGGKAYFTYHGGGEISNFLR